MAKADFGRLCALSKNPKHILQQFVCSYLQNLHTSSTGIADQGKRYPVGGGDPQMQVQLSRICLGRSIPLLNYPWVDRQTYPFSFTKHDNQRG